MFEKTSSRTVNAIAAETTSIIVNTNQALQNAMAAANGSVVDVSTAENINLRPVPDSMEISVTSAKNAEATTKTISLFNEDFLDATPTFNNKAGTGGGAIAVTYGDGRAGKKYDKMIGHAFGGNGLKIISITAVAKSEGVLDESFFANCKMKVVTETAEDGDVVATPIKWQKAISNAPNKDGIYKVLTNFTLNYLSQLKFQLPASAAASGGVDLILEVGK